MAKTGQKQSKPRLKDIARKANVSVPTVSMALADHPRISLDTKRKVWRIGEELGYRMGGRLGDTAGIGKAGMIIPHGSNADPVTSLMLMMVNSVAAKAGVRIESLCLRDISNIADVAARSAAFARECDGVLLTGFITQEIVEAVRETQTPFVVIGHPVEGVEADYVTYDAFKAGREACRHLISQGHKRIAFVAEAVIPGTANASWHDGYVVELVRAEIGVDPSLTVVHDPDTGDAAPVILAAAKRENPATAFIVPNVYMAQTMAMTLPAAGVKFAMVYLQVDQLPTPGMGAYPSVVLRNGWMCEQAFQRLLDVSVRGSNPVVAQLVPYGKMGF